MFCFAFEQMVFDERAGRDQAHDVAPHEFIGLRRFELFGQRDDETLRHQARQILRERVMRHAGHRDALSAAGFFARERDL